MSSEGLTFRDLRNAILFGAMVYLAVVFINDIVDIILVFSITALTVVSLNPFVTWLGAHRIPRAVGTVIVILALLTTIGGLVYLIAPVASKQLTQLVRDLPMLLDKISGSLAQLVKRYPSVARLIPRFDLRTLQQFARPLMGATTSGIFAISAAIVVLVTTIYTLINPKPLIDGFLDALDPSHVPRAVAAGERLAVQVKAWARGTAFAMLTIFALTWLTLSLLGFEQALLFAVIAGLLEIVPIIGPILSAVPPIIVALVTEPVMALWVVGSFVLIQQFENHVLIPVVMSRQVRLHPVTVIFWVLVMGALFGLVGIFLATPAAVSAGVLYDELFLCEYRGRCHGLSNSEDETASEDE